MKMIKINQQNYLEVKETNFLAACSYCFKDITSAKDLKKYGTDDCHYRSCSNDACFYVIENIDYCKSCFTINQPKSNDTSDRMYDESNNDDCVTVFNNDVDDDIQSVANTLKSMGDTSLFNILPDSQVNDSYLQVTPPEPLDSVMRNDTNNVLAKSLMIPVELLTMPTDTNYINDNNESDISKNSDDEDDDIESFPVNEYVKPYLMKGGICNLQQSIEKKIDFTNEFH